MAMLPTIKSNLPFVMNTLGRSDIAKKDILAKYLQLEGLTHISEFGGQQDKHGRWPFGMMFDTGLSNLKKAGVLSSPKRSVYSLEDESLILGSFIKLSSPIPTPTPTPTPTPVVEETPTPVVEETPTPVVEVSVQNSAVIEAHIDINTQELVENVGGSKDYRKPLDQVEDGYITSTLPSSVQVSTTTLETVVEDVDQPVEVEVASVEPVEVQEVVEPTLEVELPVEDNIETQEDTQPMYDIRELRKSASFDPVTINLKDKAEGSYEVYRDMEARNIVLTQKGRHDYVKIPVDVDQDRLDALNELDPRYAPYALRALNDFDSDQHHKDGCQKIVIALISCVHNCDHTDDFGGLVEPCPKPHACVLQSIWGEGAIYVNPQDS